ncbi:MAG TPA: S8 family serine peptidase, partial [Nitrospiria bacterium]|nr:S8 family serine peptidase [Nitrospiria bacterium]
MMKDMIIWRDQIRISLGRWAWMILLPALFLIYPLEAVSAPSSIMGRYIVILSDDVDSAGVEGVATELVQRHQASLEHVYTKAIKGFSASIPSHRLSLLLSDPQVNNVVEDWQVEAFCHTGTQTTPTGVARVDADLSPTAGINGIDNALDVDIAILDTGIYPHQDLNIFTSVDCTKRGGCKTVSAGDKNGHGTHVAGIAAARDNSRAVVGVAPGSRLWMVKVLGDNGSGFVSWIIAGIDFVTNYAS